jgi:hypothetical protein
VFTDSFASFHSDDSVQRFEVLGRWSSLPYHFPHFPFNSTEKISHELMKKIYIFYGTRR